MTQGKLLETITEWYCPACGKEDVTKEQSPHVRLHACPKMYGMSTPYVKKGVKAKLTAVERQDYVNKEIVQTDDRGRPIMSIITEREDGQDAVVFAPVAVGNSKEL